MTEAEDDVASLAFGGKRFSMQLIADANAIDLSGPVVNITDKKSDDWGLTTPPDAFNLPASHHPKNFCTHSTNKISKRIL